MECIIIFPEEEEDPTLFSEELSGFRKFSPALRSKSMWKFSGRRGSGPKELSLKKICLIGNYEERVYPVRELISLRTTQMKFQYIRKHLSSKKSAQNSLTGFTLVEKIVAMGIFAAVALMTVGALLQLVDAQRKAFSVQGTYDNLRFSLETIVKDLRTGGFYHCGDTVPLTMPLDCDIASGGDNSITYTNSSGNLVTYQLNAGRLEKLISGSSIGFLTPAEITITRLSFYVVGSDALDPYHARVTVVMEASAGFGRSVTTFNLQTTITQRKILL